SPEVAATEITLTETVSRSGRLVATQNGNVFELELPVGAAERRRGTATLILKENIRPGVRKKLHLTEQEQGSGQYAGRLQYLPSTPPSTTGSPSPGTAEPIGDTGEVLPSFYAGSQRLLTESTGGEYHPFAIRVRAPAPIAEHLRVRLGPEGGPNFVGDFKAEPSSKHAYLQRTNNTSLLVLTLKAFGAKTAEPNDAVWMNLLEELGAQAVNYANFRRGFTVGFAAGGYHLVADTAHLAWGTLEYAVNGYVIRGCKIRIWMKGLVGADSTEEQLLAFELQQKRDAIHTGLKDTFLLLAVLSAKYEQAKHQFVLDLLTGNSDALYLSETHEQMLMMAAELLRGVIQEYLSQGSYKQGYVMGRVAFEVMSIFTAPELLAAKLTKLELLEKLANLKIFQPGGIGYNAYVKLAALMGYLRVTDMCFVAGTKVWTEHGCKNIEDIRPGDLVLSQDEFSRKQAFKPVLATLVTHPNTLVHVRYSALSRHGAEGGGDPDSDCQDEQLVCTPQHPFFVDNGDEPKFIEAGDLKVGDLLSLWDGRTGIVTEVLQRGVAPGESST
ncbi:MAG: hypothetical protein EOP84_21930, partial [Verrucomicrobiaceae bacterium]